MPSPQPGEEHEEFIQRCIPIVIEEGTAKDGEEARAICESQWQEGENMKIKGENKRFAKLRPTQAGQDVNFRVAATNEQETNIYLYDVIGFPFIEAQDLLYQIPQNTKKINVYINSPGGDVFEGMAIFNFLKSHQAEVNVRVDALAASSASLVAVSGDSIDMADASFIMIHNPWSMMAGDAEELRKEAELLDKISNVFADAYVAKSGKDKNEVLELMQAETWFTPQEAKDYGLTDAVSGGEINASLDRFDMSIFNNAPKTVRNAATYNNKNKNNTEVIEMPKNLRALLERLGLSKEATDKEAWDYLATVDLNQVESKEEQEQIQAALEAKTDPNKDKKGDEPQNKDPEKIAKDAIKAERERAANIKNDVEIAGLDQSVAEDLIQKDCTEDQARQQILAKMKETNPPVGAGRIQIGKDGQEKFREAVVDGLAHRIGVRNEKPAEGYEAFRAASIENVARQCLERNGTDTRALTSRDQVAREVLRQAASGGFSTDDFSSIFLDVANKTLMKAYQEAPATWRPWVNVVSASDFKTIHGISLSEAPDLELVNEHGEYKSGEMSDRQESYSVGSYGKIVYLTRQMIVNDDLRAFARLPQLMGAAARRKEADLVYGKLTGNPTMSDSNALFSSAHSNLEGTTANKAHVASDNLSAARAVMRKQKGPNGAILDLYPSFVLVPVSQETSAEIALRSRSLPQTEMSSGVYNPWADKLTPIAEPRLDNNSTDAWYLVADPNQVDTIEVAYLDGREAPYTEQEAMFERDAIGYKVRHDLGVGAMDWRGFFKNPGA